MAFISLRSMFARVLPNSLYPSCRVEAATGITQVRFVRRRSIERSYTPGKASRLTKNVESKTARRSRLMGASVENDEPVDFGAYNPYEKDRRQCLLCRTGVEVSYKNPRLLSQFLSSFTGRSYERHITGLCKRQQTRVRNAIIQSRRAGYMPVFQKNAHYLKDPPLFDPMRPQRKNPY